jgi:5-methylcytosine-specific restriction endonuclease McrA
LSASPTFTPEQRAQLDAIKDRLAMHVAEHGALVIAIKAIIDAGFGPGAFGHAVLECGHLSDDYHRPLRAHGRTKGTSRSRLTGNHWISLSDQVYARDGSRCRYCGDVAGPFHIDHIQPLRHGGSNLISNLVVACRECNLSKGAKLITEWQPRRRARRRL